MHYILCVSLERFYTGVLASRASVSCLCVVRDRRVIDADEAATAKGISPGMDERVAKAILGSASFFKWNRQDFELAQTTWLDRCVPFTDVIEPADQHLAFLDLSAHPYPREIALRIVSELNMPARFGAGPSKWIAELSARKAGVGNLVDSAVSSPVGYLSTLPIEDLSPVAWEHRERLRFLGYRRVGEIAELPYSVLKGQFGADALGIQQAAQGKLRDAVLALYPPQSISETMSFEGGIESTEMLDEALGQLAGKLGERLVARELQGAEVRLYAELESGRIVAAKRRFQKAVRCERSAVSALRLLVPAFDEPVVRLRVVLPNLTRAPRVQRDLLNVMPISQKETSAEAALKSLAAVYGDKAVQTAGEIVVPRRVLVLREWRDAMGWR